MENGHLVEGSAGPDLSLVMPGGRHPFSPRKTFPLMDDSFKCYQVLSLTQNSLSI